MTSPQHDALVELLVRVEALLGVTELNMDDMEHDTLGEIEHTLDALHTVRAVFGINERELEAGREEVNGVCC